MLSVNQHWDKLKACAVGRSYPPELYDFIENPKVRNMMEKIAIETEEDYQKIIAKLEEFDVKVVRNDLDLNEDGSIRFDRDGVRYAPPMYPRDTTMMVGDKFYMPGDEYINWRKLVINEGVDPNVVPETWSEVKKLTDSHLKKRIIDILKVKTYSIAIPSYYKPVSEYFGNTFESIRKYVEEQGNEIIFDHGYNAACCSRIGKDLYFGTIFDSIECRKELKGRVSKSFPDYRCHVLPIAGHSDARFCPVVPGLIVSLHGDNFYKNTFPDWEVVSIPNQGFDAMEYNTDHEYWKQRTGGRWWIEGQSYDDDLVNYIDKWLYHWVNYVEETVFDVNMLVIDKNNVICSNYNEKVFKKFDEYGITAHVINFRHRFFWDGGIHCITSDLDREGIREDYFPERG